MNSSVKTSYFGGGIGMNRERRNRTDVSTYLNELEPMLAARILNAACFLKKVVTCMDE